MVVLASVPDLQSGFSRELFTRWCEDKKNTIILTNRTTKGTLARQLIENNKISTLEMEIKSQVKLEGEELEVHRQKMEEEKKEQERLEEERQDQEESDSDMSDEEPEAHIPGEKQAQHDLLLTSTQAKSRSGFFKQAKKMFPMFPYVEEVLTWDDYGEIINPEDFNFSEVKLVDIPAYGGGGQRDGGMTAPPGGETVERLGDESMDTTEREDQKEKEEDGEETPTKYIMEKKTFNIAAKILYIDFEGRSDSKSIKELLEKIKPRQLILVHGSMDSTLALAKHCQENSVCLGEVFSPSVGETIDATTERHIFQVKLMDSLVSQLKFSKTATAELAWVDAQVKIPELDVSEHELMEDDTSVQKTAEERREEKLGKREARRAAALAAGQVQSLNRLPTSKIPPHKAIFFNEPKLSDLKQVFQRAGFQAEFNKGNLIINDLVAVKRTVSGMIQLEGCICEDYFAVRQLLYGQYAIV